MQVIPTILPIPGVVRREDVTQILDSDRQSRVQSYLGRARLRMIQSVQRLQAIDRWDSDIPGEIPWTFDTAIEEIRRCSEPTKGALLGTLHTSAGEIEEGLRNGLDQAPPSTRVSVMSELRGVMGACAMAQFIAVTARDNPEYLDQAPSLAALASEGREVVKFQGKLDHLYGRTCDVAGVKVVLPDDESLLRRMSPGMNVVVEGILGRRATVFATSVSSA